MPKKLSNIRITHVSYVDKGANQKRFFLMKGIKPNVDIPVRTIIKKDDPKKLVYGVVYEPDTVDSHGHFAAAEDIEKAAHGFMLEYRLIDKQHDSQAGAGAPVESYIPLVDFEFNGEQIKKGSWVLVTKASDQAWAEIQNGDFGGYSMAGSAEVEEVESIEKAYADGLAYDMVSQATYRLANVLSGLMWDGKTTDEVLESVDQFKAFVTQLLTTSIQKEGGEVEMNPEDIKKAVTEALQPVMERLDKLEKAQTKPVEGESLVVEKSEELTQLQADIVAVKKDMGSLVEELRKSKQPPHSDDPGTVEKSADSGLL